MRKLIRRREGFTLIELMIVILIIAILVAIAIPVYLNAKANAERRTCQANIRTVDGAIETYDASADAYPANLAAMVSGANPVLKKVPFCPSNGGTTSYIWVAPTGGIPEISCPNVANHTI